MNKRRRRLADFDPGLRVASWATLLWFVGWAALLLVAGVLAGCSAVEWRQTAEFCDALSPVLRALSECVP